MRVGSSLVGRFGAELETHTHAPRVREADSLGQSVGAALEPDGTGQASPSRNPLTVYRPDRGLA